MLPFKGKNRVTQPYTYNINSRKGHGGIDVVGDDDKTVRAVASGKVTMVSKWDGHTKTGTQSYGNLVVITEPNGTRHYYAHLDSISVRLNDNVSVGEKVGIMGNTGNSFGAHLHYEVRTGQKVATRVNPAPYINIVNAKGTYFENEKPTQYVIPNETLNIRKGAGVGYDIAIKNGAKGGVEVGITEVKRVGTQDWGKLADGRGWLCLAYCRKKGAGKAYTITCDWLKIRKSPSLVSSVVGKWHKGEMKHVIERRGNWCKLENGTWCCAGKYLKEV